MRTGRATCFLSSELFLSTEFDSKPPRKNNKETIDLDIANHVAESVCLGLLPLRTGLATCFLSSELFLSTEFDSKPPEKTTKKQLI